MQEFWHLQSHHVGKTMWRDHMDTGRDAQEYLLFKSSQYQTLDITMRKILDDSRSPAFELPQPTLSRAETKHLHWALPKTIDLWTKFVSKSICFKPLSFRVICHTALANQVNPQTYSKPPLPCHMLEISLTRLTTLLSLKNIVQTSSFQAISHLYCWPLSPWHAVFSWYQLYNSLLGSYFCLYFSGCFHLLFFYPSFPNYQIMKCFKTQAQTFLSSNSVGSPWQFFHDHILVTTSVHMSQIHITHLSSWPITSNSLLGLSKNPEILHGQDFKTVLMIWVSPHLLCLGISETWSLWGYHFYLVFE